eukprot:TRINITY_DN5635_c0_g1_i1.p1 TRINITY_DN5635_c0_g1~~TRINITY_DN5635_c0_g1_i1.p1  ORF type:complete len:219 (+),score=19.22 TRINITY_DN5635_c0_g1_i1:510-1166(+)
MLIKLARDTGKTNPIFISRMLAMVVQSMRTGKSLVDAMEVFTTFCSNIEEGPQDIIYLQLLKQVINDPTMDAVLNIENFRRLNGMILRNTQRLNPVSNFHLYLNGLPEAEQYRVVSTHTKDITPSDFIQTDYMQQLCISGTGMFSLGNSMNHSCIPNVISASCGNDCRITMVASRSIKKGEELFLSYIDEDASFQERNKILKQMYYFDCSCLKCISKQ